MTSWLYLVLEIDGHRPEIQVFTAYGYHKCSILPFQDEIKNSLSLLEIETEKLSEA